MNDSAAGLMAFLQARAAEDEASHDKVRHARARVVLMVVGLAGNTPENFRDELNFLADHYSGHPDWRELAPWMRYTGRTGITIDRSADYCRLATWRVNDPGERARALGVPKPPPVPDGQASLFEIWRRDERHSSPAPV